MAKQLNLYLEEPYDKRLAEIAARNCRRPVDQARWILRQALGIAEDQQVESTDKTQNDAGRTRQDSLASAVL